MARLSADAVAHDAQTLAGWLKSKAGLTLSPVTLAANAPAHVRAFWENVGWHESFARDLELLHPNAEQGRTLALATLAAWREDDGGAFPDDRLPSHFRMVFQDNAGESFLITDESKPSDNPVLVGVVRDQKRKLVPTRTRYLKRVSQPLIQRALAGMHQVGVDLVLKDDKVVQGSPLLPVLGTGMRQLGEGLILLGVKKDRGVRFLSIAFTEFERLIEWMASIPGVRQMQAPLTGLRVNRNEAALGPVLDAMTKVKSTRTIDDRKWKTVLGRLEGHWMVVEHSERQGSALVDPADRGVFAAMAAHGCPLDFTPKQISSPYAGAEGKAPSLKQVEGAAETLSKLLCELNPAHAAAREPAEFEDDAPACLAAILRAVGRSPAIERALPVDRNESRKHLRPILTRWFDAPLPRDVWQHESGMDVLAHLPERLRLIGYRPEQKPNRIPMEQLEYIDEGDDAGDPPLLGRRAGEFSPAQVDTRISNYLFQHLIAIAAGRERSATSWFNATKTPTPTGKALVFPRVCPAIFRLAPGVYGSVAGLYFTSDQAYDAWLAGLPLNDVRLGGRAPSLPASRLDGRQEAQAKRSGWAGRIPPFHARRLEPPRAHRVRLRTRRGMARLDPALPPLASQPQLRRCGC